MLHLFQISFIAVVVAAAVYDLRERRIPNFLTAAVMAAALPMHLMYSGMAGGTFWFLGLAAGAGLLFIPYALGGIGAGDVKFLACAGSVLGPMQVFCAFLAAGLIGGLMAAAKVGGAERTMPVGGVLPGPRKDAPAAIPYGLPLAVGILLSATGAWV
ncbi:MAG TPA: prepilin peptidase [Planctomycetota bacterium]|nr:prepilin peptidase [Planctomycetota bacterium]